MWENNVDISNQNKIQNQSQNQNQNHQLSRGGGVGNGGGKDTNDFHCGIQVSHFSSNDASGVNTDEEVSMDIMAHHSEPSSKSLLDPNYGDLKDVWQRDTDQRSDSVGDEEPETPFACSTRCLRAVTTIIVDEGDMNPLKVN